MSIDDQKTSSPRVLRRPSTAPAERVPAFEYRQLDGECVHCLTHVDRLDPFFMALVSSEDHWMFIASNGAVTCGRGHADQALFPYYSADKLLDLRHSAGPKTLIRWERSAGTVLWEPFAEGPAADDIERHLYKNVLGSQVTFEEIHHTLGLSFSYRWNLSPRFGFVRTCELQNLDSAVKSLTVLDGLQNIQPGGLQQDFQLRFGNLANAYKKSELINPAQLGVYYLNSIPSDRAEPCEGLLASVVWSFGLDDPLVLLSTRQCAAFRQGRELTYETDIRGQAGCYLLAQSLSLPPRESRCWGLVADVHRDSCDLENLQFQIEHAAELPAQVKADIRGNDTELWKFASQVDGLQRCRDQRRSDRHLSNALFNLLRGGVPAQGYQIPLVDFRRHVQAKNRNTAQRHADWWPSLPAILDLQHLVDHCASRQDPDLARMAAEYLPLTLSRRHGDPTRPWNRFNIQTRAADGSRRIGFEGNWRDIFQNWEALSLSFPHLLPAMILRFVNASTVDGYNPYRLNQNGVDWERPEPHDPWSNIGYWGDHQIVYLGKLLEQAQAMVPERLEKLLDCETCVYTRVPYRVRDFQAMIDTPHHTIDFDWDEDLAVRQAVQELGFDGQLLADRSGRGPYYVTLLEKLLLTALVKLTHFVPQAGIWMNTQRPEWNDAQNALAGRGASLVTVGYLHRYLCLLRDWLARSACGSGKFSSEVCELFAGIASAYSEWLQLPSDRRACNRQRYEFVARLQQLGHAYRQQVYTGFSGVKQVLSPTALQSCLQETIDVLADTLRHSRRDDGLYHSFCFLEFSPGSLAVEPLEEMLEGQVSILESGVLSADQAHQLLRELRASRLYRADQDSYLLYPNRVLPRFNEKNRIRVNDESDRALLGMLAEIPAQPLVRRDHRGDFHFAGTLRNGHDLEAELDRLSALAALPTLEPGSLKRLRSLWEQTFQHRRFTGRATTFFAYEGLGSIYWHMVSKLALATLNQAIAARQAGSPLERELLQHFRQINEGIWLNKTPQRYGAFSTDPYSHTPLHAGAQQPGMTGQVKEDLLVRFGELGLRFQQGRIEFDPGFVRPDEFTSEPVLFQYWDQQLRLQALDLPRHALAFTVNQVPVIYRHDPGGAALRLIWRDGQVSQRSERRLNLRESQAIFLRTGEIQSIEVQVSQYELPET